MREHDSYYPPRLADFFPLEKFDEWTTLLDREFDEQSQITFSTADGLRFPSMGSESPIR